MAREKTTNISVDNTLEGWTRLLEQGNGARSIAVTTQIYGVLDDQQLFSLRHCFIALDQLEVRYRAPVSLALHISVNSINDAYRIQYYLAIMTTFRNVALEIICGEERLLGLQRLSNEYYRIMPLLCVGNKQQSWEIHYPEITKPGNIGKIRELFQASFQPKSPVKPVYKRRSAKQFLNQALMSNLWNMQQNISGDSDAAMTKKTNMCYAWNCAASWRKNCLACVHWHSYSGLCFFVACRTARICFTKTATIGGR